MINNFTPNVRCVLSVLYAEERCAEMLIKRLSVLGFENLKINKAISYNEFSINLSSNIKQDVWDIDEAISYSFSSVKDKLNELKAIVDETNGRFFVGIIIEKFDVYPTMLFSGENMKVIHFLNADISMDCLDFGTQT
ncbi:MAG: hypothetical protein K2O41_07095 [Clostridia bacterium]|nr:hypothetical protein [Clostridia bacterium]